VPKIPTFDVSDLTDDAVLQLQGEACASGDWATVDLCDLALAGNAEARGEISDQIAYNIMRSATN
jgi:hypothetical protein